MRNSEAAAEADYQESQRSYRPPTPQYAESYMSVAWNFNTSEVWATSGHRTGAQAEKVVLDACNQAMGGDCVIGAQWVNDSFIAVAHDGFGIPWIKGGANKKSVAETNALTFCRKHSFECNITKVFGQTLIPINAGANRDLSKNFFPIGSLKRHSLTLAAWPEKEPAPSWIGTIWISSGEVNWNQARKRLIAKCASDTGIMCKVGSVSSNGVLVRYIDQTGQKYWIGLPSARTAPDHVKKLCKPGSRCWIVDWVDANVQSFVTVNQDKVAPAGRGYFSLAWTSDWPEMAVATVRNSSAIAEADALALCSSQSKKKCELFLDNPDNGNGKFLAVFKDSGGSIRTYIGFSPDELDYRAGVSCEAAKVKCTKRLMLDLTTTLAQTFVM